MSDAGEHLLYGARSFGPLPSGLHLILDNKLFVKSENLLGSRGSILRSHLEKSRVLCLSHAFPLLDIYSGQQNTAHNEEEDDA